MFFLFILTAALPPANVRILRTAVDSVVLEWTEPPLLGGEIMGYKVGSGSTLGVDQGDK